MKEACLFLLNRLRDNGIIYEYDVRKCMFSSGNVTEKLRVAKFDCHNQVVVDLFAGMTPGEELY